MNIEWKAKIGYGDFVSPISYAYMQSFRKKKFVTLWFHYKNKANWKYNNKTPWSIFSLANYIHNASIEANVECYHSFDDDYNVDHINYFNGSSAHNFWLSEYHNRYERNIIVINTTLDNEIPMSVYAKDKQWKDELNNKWPEFIKTIKEKNPNETIVEVSYRSPIREVHDLYARCKLAIGYHGSTMWMGKFLYCPMFIFSKHIATTKYFPWAYTSDDMKEFFDYPLDYWIESSKLFQIRFKDIAEDYAPGCYAWLGIEQ